MKLELMDIEAELKNMKEAQAELGGLNSKETLFNVLQSIDNQVIIACLINIERMLRVIIKRGA